MMFNMNEALKETGELQKLPTGFIEIPSISNFGNP